MAHQAKTVADIMSPDVQYIPSGSTLEEAAAKMRELDCGFLPISDSGQKKLLGVITDRDIVLRAVAEGKDPRSTSVEDIKSDKVLYCFRHDTLETAAGSMHDQQVYRLVVLDGRESKQLCGVITLNDIVRHDEKAVAASVASGIAA